MMMLGLLAWGVGAVQRRLWRLDAGRVRTSSSLSSSAVSAMVEARRASAGAGGAWSRRDGLAAV
jgi:hypothetical protein